MYPCEVHACMHISTVIEFEPMKYPASTHDVKHELEVLAAILLQVAESTISTNGSLVHEVPKQPTLK